MHHTLADVVSEKPQPARRIKRQMNIPTLQQLLEAGVHFGHRVSRGNPRMKQYIYGARDGVHIIDLELSEKGLREATEYVKNLGKSGGVLLFVGTKKQAQAIVEEQSKKVEAPYMTSRWIGGFLTNFEEIKKNIKKLKELKEQKEKGELSKYTKKEQLLIDRKISKLTQDLGGVENLDKLPDCLFVVDGAREDVALREARRVSIPTVAIADTNSDPTLIDYPIPGNDDAIKSIKLIVETIAAAYGEGKKEALRLASLAQGKQEREAEKAEAKRIKDENDKSEELPEEIKEEVADAEEKVEKEELEKAERKVE